MLRCHVEEAHWSCVKCPVEQGMMLQYDQVSQETGLEPGALRGLSWSQVTVQAAFLTARRLQMCDSLGQERP